jgi:hypothetical protein
MQQSTTPVGRQSSFTVVMLESARKARAGADYIKAAQTNCSMISDGFLNGMVARLVFISCGSCKQLRPHTCHSYRAVEAEMRKSELLKTIQDEIQRHNLSMFMSAEHKVVQTGCSTCRKHFGTVEQFEFHLCDDVLPSLLDRLSAEAQN